MKIPARAETLVDRAAMTAAQSALAYIGSAAALNALTLDWVAVGGVALGGALASLLTNIARGGITGRANTEE